MNSLLQAALRDGSETLKTLTERYALKVKRHGVHPNLVQIKYDQIASPMANLMVREARGIILNETSDWDIVARPFDKFFNLGEGHAAPIDWSTARVQEKLDGSLAIVYYYRGTWHMATSGTPDGSGPVGDHGMTFQELFWKTWDDLGYDTNDLGTSFTYMFELMTKYNRIVVPHEKPRIALLGARHTMTGFELAVSDVDEVTREARLADNVSGSRQFEVVKQFPLTDLKAIEDSFATIDGLHQEGYVVVDAKFNRVKIKHPQYVAYHHMVGALTPKKVLDAVRHGESPEVVSYFPEWKAEFESVGAKLAQLVEQYEAAYQTIKGLPNQKDFAIAAQKLGLPTTAPLFAVRKSEQPAKPFPTPDVILNSKRLAKALEEAQPPTPITFKQFFAEVPLDRLAEWLQLKEVENVAAV